MAVGRIHKRGSSHLAAGQPTGVGKPAWHEEDDIKKPPAKQQDPAMSEIAASLTSPREHPPANASTRSCRTNLAAATTQMNRGRHKPGHDLRERPARLTR